MERSTPHFTVSVSLRCLQGTVLPTLPPRVLQGAAVSGERISQGPPGNVVALGCPPPPRRVSERSVQMVPLGLPFQNVILNAQLHINPETRESRAAGTSSRILTAWKLLPNISHWVLQTIEKGYQYSLGLARPGLWRCFHRGGPPAGSGNGTRSESSVREGVIEYVPHSNRETGLYSRYFIVPKKDEGLRSILDLRVLNDSVIQLKFKMLTLRNHATDQIRGLVCHDRSQGRILPHIHPSVSQQVPEVRSWGQSIPISGSSVLPSIITPHFHEMRRCGPGTSLSSGYSHNELH